MHTVDSIWSEIIFRVTFLCLCFFGVSGSVGHLRVTTKRYQSRQVQNVWNEEMQNRWSEESVPEHNPPSNVSLSQSTNGERWTATARGAVAAQCANPQGGGWEKNRHQAKQLGVDSVRLQQRNKDAEQALKCAWNRAGKQIVHNRQHAGKPRMGRVMLCHSQGCDFTTHPSENFRTPPKRFLVLRCPHRKLELERFQISSISSCRAPAKSQKKSPLIKRCFRGLPSGVCKF